MVIIPIDDFKKKRGAFGDPEPKITMKDTGRIQCNIAAAKLLKLDEGKNYIHFYEENENIFIKKDNDPKHAICLKFIAIHAKCDCYNKNVARYFINNTLPEYKEVSFLVSAADYGKFSITPII